MLNKRSSFILKIGKQNQQINLIYFGTPAILGKGGIIKISSHETEGHAIMYLNMKLDSPGGYT